MDRFHFHNGRDSILLDHIRGMMLLEDQYLTIEDPFNYILYKKQLESEKVRIITSGGGGLGALFSCFVGQGLADGMAHGDFGCAPTAYALFELAKKIHTPKGILFLTNNFAGDFLNNDMAVELLESEGIPSKVIYCCDDIFSASGEPRENRGGLCGIGFLIKIAAEAAKQGLSLHEVESITRKAESNLRSVTITIDDQDQIINFGEGFSGEKASVSLPYRNLDDLVNHAINFLLDDFQMTNKNHDYHCFVSINRLRKMSLVESYAAVYSVSKKIQKSGIPLGRITTGSYFDAFDSNGCIISILFADQDLIPFIKPVTSYSFTI
jgi:dihydroxyacetone kinase-like protein